MARKFKSEIRSKSETPSPSPLTSWSHSKSPTPRHEVVKKSLEYTIVFPEKSYQHSSTKSPKVHSLIYKWQGISLSQEEYELSQAIFLLIFLLLKG